MSAPNPKKSDQPIEELSMSHKPPQIPFSSGTVSKQTHVDLPNGTFEEEYGRQGFFGRTTHLYRKNAPTGWTRIDGPLHPHAYDANAALGTATTAPKRFLGNDDVCLWIYAPQKQTPHYVRNADGDEAWFIHAGSGFLETDFGPLKYRKGDYLVVPRGTTYRFFPDAGAPQFYLLIESFSEFELPDRGSLGRHAFLDPACIDVPQAAASGAPATDGKEWKLKIKRQNEYTDVYYPFNPLNVVGWRGDAFAYRFNVEDIRPIISPRFHLPPSVHTTLMAKNFVLCTFAPRPMETGDPKAQRVPFFHSNIEFDEVIFYHDGDFFSRSGITPGMFTFHPQGIHHGPHPKAFANQFSKEFAQEYAVMIDTTRPLKAFDTAVSCEMVDYKNSWKEYAKP